MKQQKIFAIIIVTISLFSLQCMKDPTSVGKDLLPPGDSFSVADTTFSNYKDTVVSVTIPMGTGGSNLVGNTSFLNSKALVKFNPISFPDSLKNASIEKASIIFSINYEKNISSSLQFSLFEIQSNWSSTTFTIDSLNLLTQNSIVSGNSNSDDISIGKKIVFNTVDTSIIRKWIRASYDTLAPKTYGFIVRPSSEMENTGVFGFSPFGSDTLSPKLQIIFLNNVGTKDTVTISSGEDTFVATSTEVYGDDIVLQSGTATRGMVYFDVSHIPINSTINNAMLELTLNTEKSELGKSNFADSIIVSTTDSAKIKYAVLGTKKTSDASIIYSANVSFIVDSWLHNVNINEGFVLRSPTENSTVNKLVFYSSYEVDVKKRPKLFITYSKK